MFGIIFGFISLVLCIAIPVVIEMATDFQLLHFSLFFIVPVGALIVGYICGFGYFKGLIKSNVMITKKQYIIGIILAIICIVGIKYVVYSFTCIDPDTYDIVYTLEGDHISNYEMDGYGQLDFFNFQRFMIESTPISFSYKARAIGEVSNPIVAWLFFFIDFAGVIIGSLFAGFIQKSNNRYCTNCSLYKKKKPLFKLSLEDGEELLNLLKDKQESIEFDETLQSIESRYINKPSKKEEHYSIGIYYCTNCNHTTLYMEQYVLNSKKNIEQNNQFEFEQQVNYSFVRSYI